MTIERQVLPLPELIGEVTDWGWGTSTPSNVQNNSGRNPGDYVSLESYDDYVFHSDGTQGLSVIIPSGEGEQEIDINILNDNVFDGDDIIILQIENGSFGFSNQTYTFSESAGQIQIAVNRNSSTQTAIITIRDDDNGVTPNTADNNPIFLYGTDDNNFIEGGEGNNVINGQEGNDSLYGGAGDDTLLGGTEQGSNEDYLNGGDGNDFLAGQAGNDTLNGGMGDDTLSSSGRLFGDSGNDYLRGDSSNDTLEGEAGDDILIGGFGDDTLVGGAGNDTYVMSSSDSDTDTITEEANNGTDTVESPVDFMLGDNLENLTLGGFFSEEDDINGTGNALNNTMTGNDGNNSLSGEAGNDYLNGGAGNDTISGGDGNDELIGEDGSDEFVFYSSTEGIDSVSFNGPEGDKITVSASGFGGGLTIGSLSSSQFTIGAVATDASNRFIYNSSTGGLFFDVDGVGGLEQTQFASLSTGLNLSSSDIWVIA